ncbi:MAG: hypothetical protein QOI24_2769 [Acidobacteriota bacterium]|nr:hypothetical protein [Acidobacteriota bacterium]
MTDETKSTIDILQKELAQTRAKSVSADDWFFRFLSIAVVPFFAFVAYVLANVEYRIYLAALPLLSIIGVAVVLVLATHYIYATTYCEYLERRLNRFLGSVEVRESEFNKAAYRRLSSPVGLSYAVGFGALFLMNVVAKGLIDLQIGRFLATHPNLPTTAVGALKQYWLIIGTAAAAFVCLGLLCLCLTYRACSALKRSVDTLATMPLESLPVTPAQSDPIATPDTTAVSGIASASAQNSRAGATTNK